MELEAKRATVPYVSFLTLTNLAERLEPEPPPRIDKSVLGYLSGGYRAQVLAALRWLDLIDDNGTPKEDLVKLVTVPAQRKDTIRRVWQAAYHAVFEAVDSSRATADQLDEAFDPYGVTSDTKRKAITFFVHGAKYADIPLSTHILAKVRRTRGAGARRPRTPRVTGGAAKNEDRTLTLKITGLHPMLEGATQWLVENGPNWKADVQEAWCEQFVSAVKLVYPAKG